MEKMNQKQLNAHLIRENIRLQAQIDLVTFIAMEVVGANIRFDRNYLNNSPDRRRQAEDMMVEGIKKYQIPLVQASALMTEEEKEKYISEIKKLKYIDPSLTPAQKARLLAEE